MSETLTRSVPFELRATDDTDGLTMAGYAAVFNSPTRIDSWEGRFDETIVRGAFAKTINARERVVVQFDHGKHPFFGSMPLGRITDMREDDHGLYLEVRMSDNWFIQPIRDAIRDEAITGMSFRFSVPEGGDNWDHSGDVPTRTISEVRLYEAGPVVHPAYTETSVGVRSALSLLDADERHNLLADETGGYRRGGKVGPKKIAVELDGREIARTVQDLLAPKASAPTSDEDQATTPVPATPDEGQRSSKTTAAARERRLTLLGIT